METDRTLDHRTPIFFVKDNQWEIVHDVEGFLTEASNIYSIRIFLKTKISTICGGFQFCPLVEDTVVQRDGTYRPPKN